MAQFEIDKVAFRFFESHIDPQKPICLALSGGPDSLCLLHLLLEWKKANLHLIHVDHGWRKESAQEAHTLREVAERLHLPFHTTRLSPEGYSGNLEAESRNDRLQFFRKVCGEVKAQGVLLGHHKDDQAETVLKRVLEGVALSTLAAMAPLQKIDGLLLMRPLLTIPKMACLAWLEARNIPYFRDPTNEDARFLRGRMRSHIFPFLSAHFGKGCMNNLCHIAEEARALRAYLDTQIEPYFKIIIASDLGLMIEKGEIAEVELSHLLKKVGLEVGMELNRQQLSIATEAIMKRQANIRVIASKQALECDRGNCFFVKKEIIEITDRTPLVLGEQVCGSWKIVTEEGWGDTAPLVRNHWKDVWQGRVSSLVPLGEYFLMRGQAGMRHHSSKLLGRFLNEKKVPNFLLPHVPMCVRDDTVLEDFLTGTGQKPQGERWLYIVMQRIV